LFGGFFGQAALIFGRQDFAGDGGRGLDNQTANLTFEFGQHAGVVLGGSFTRFGDDLLGGGDGLLGFLLLDAGGGGAGFFDKFGGLRVCFLKGLALQSFSASEFGFDLFGVCQALGDTLAPLLEHCEDGLVSETIKQKGNEAKANDLSEEMRLVQAERLRCAFCSFSEIAADAAKKNELIHVHLKFVRRGAGATPRLKTAMALV